MERPVDASRLGSALVLCAGVTLGQAWVSAQPKPATVRQAPPAFRQAAPPSGCAPAVTVGDAAFYALTGGGLRDAAVWIDDVDSGLSGRFLPFQVVVVVGRVSAPFSLKEGKLSREAFLKYTNGNYNTLVAPPIVVDKDTRRGERAFTQSGRTFVLKVLGVQAATFSRDTVTLQLCW
jgi:hypothetical protein